LIDFATLPETSSDTYLPPAALSADGRDLLAQFASTGRQEPFEEIVRRYGGMVFNLCYEVTGNRHDAEDAVQAAFLSLAVQCKSGTPVHAIGPWLQQVARRLSLDINRSRKRRKNREAIHGESWETRMTDARAEGSGGAGAHGNPASAAGWGELRGVVQQELGALPPKYRMPLILHYYGGLSREEMARELNCKPNTLGVRLHRGREMLSKRLEKRGVTVTGVILGVVMAEVVHSIVTDRLVHSTAQAAVLLSAGHPYACGIVSPQIAMLAQTGARALANAKIRLAATLALLAGGAAAAGAQVVARVGPWSIPQMSNWDLGRAFRWLFHPPTISGPTAEGPREKAPTVAVNPVTPDAIAVAPATPKAPAPKWDWRNGMDWNFGAPSGTRGVDPAYAQHWTYPPVPYAPPTNGIYPLPPYKSMPANNSGLAGGGGGAGGRGDSNAKPGAVGKDPATSNDSKLAKDPAQDPSNLGNDSNNNNNSNTPPGRGGVKPRQPNSDIANDDGSAKPKAFTPDGIAKQSPVPPPIPQQPGRPPILGPGAPQQPPITPPDDAEKVTQPPPPPATPGNSGASSSGGGYRDGDVLHISSDYDPAGAPSFDQVMASGIGNSYFELGAGNVAVNKDVIVGHLGSGVANQTGGLHTLDSLYLGVIKTGRGMYQLTGGELQFTASPVGADVAAHSLEIGGAGEGVFLLGNADSTGQITQVGETGGPVNLTVGAIRSANGTLRGWGTVGLTGTVSNNGRIIADGYGQDRSLDLSSFATVTNDFLNRNGAKGWYAVNHGRLDLPPIAVSRGTNTYTWGGSNDDERITLVNSARLTFTDVQSDATVKIALLALDRSDTPAFPTDHHLVGMWSFDQSDLTGAGGMDLLVRYDDAVAAAKGLDENVLKLWKYDGQWERLDFDPTFVRDPANHTLFVHIDSIAGMSYFAVSAPEPGMLGLLTGGLCLLGLGRGRRGR
jgi:RNA polymerase sigma factor (sigma-70 family)